MGKKTRYHVTKREDGSWQGAKEKSERASVVADTKEEVLKKTIEIAKNQDEAQVIIHKEDGKIQSERTYGSDPHPPEG